MGNVKAIVLHMENLTKFTIYEENIAEIYLGDFKKYCSRKYSNLIYESEEVNTFYIHVHKDANLNDNRSTVDYSSDSPFERILKWRDITQVELQYEDETVNSKKYDVIYTHVNHFDNLYQKTKIDESTGDLYIVISKDLNLEDVFDFDEKSVKFYWEVIKSDYEFDKLQCASIKNGMED